jgi:palmitoyl-protein thioesterase
MGKIQGIIKDHLGQDVPVFSLCIGEDPETDASNSFVMNANTQIKYACDLLAKNANIFKASGGLFNAIGFSQGSQFLRAVVQRCTNNQTLASAGIPLRVHNLISIGGQQQGVFGFPRCLGESSTLCEVILPFDEINKLVPSSSS